jgi:predicted CXXCH cytochrome family protein
MDKMQSRLRITGIAVAVLLGAVIFLSLSGHHHIHMDGELGKKHSGMNNDCRACHTPWHGVADDNCLNCHKDATGHLPATAEKDKLDKMGSARCGTCHQEHGGARRNIMAVKDSACAPCHKLGRHPEIKGLPEIKKPEHGRIFPHSVHALKVKGLEMQKCFMCHDDDGENGKLTYDYSRLNGFVCLNCHKGRFDVPAPAKGHRYIYKANFPHDKHAVTTDCMTCHANLLKYPEMSKENLPSVADCEKCHERSSGSIHCVKCHTFHQPPPPPGSTPKEDEE